MKLLHFWEQQETEFLKQVQGAWRRVGRRAKLPALKVFPSSTFPPPGVAVIGAAVDQVSGVGASAGHLPGRGAN